jgi:hypothetical protein
MIAAIESPLDRLSQPRNRPRKSRNAHSRDDDQPFQAMVITVSR